MTWTIWHRSSVFCTQGVPDLAMRVGARNRDIARHGWDNGRPACRRAQPNVPK